MLIHFISKIKSFLSPLHSLVLFQMFSNHFSGIPVHYKLLALALECLITAYIPTRSSISRLITSNINFVQYVHNLCLHFYFCLDCQFMTIFGSRLFTITECPCHINWHFSTPSVISWSICIFHNSFIVSSIAWTTPLSWLWNPLPLHLVSKFHIYRSRVTKVNI